MRISTYLFGFFIMGLLSQNLYAQTANAGSDQEICTNHTFLNADAPPIGYTGTWSVISGYCSFTNNHSNSTEVTGLLKGINELKWVISNGTITDDDNVIILNNTTTTAQTGDDEAICTNTFTLAGTALDNGENGLWSILYGSGTFVNASLNFTDVNGMLQGLNTYRWSISKGICSSYDEISVTNNEAFAQAGVDNTTCNDYFTLSATNPVVGTGSWSVVSSSGTPIFWNINSPVSLITNLGINSNSLQWTVVNANCTAYDNVIITSHKPTQANAGTDKTVCSTTTSMQGNNPTYGTGQWSVVSGSGNFVNINGYNTVVNNLSPGSNNFKWTVTYFTCPSEDQVNIYYDYFTANAGTDDVTCINSYNLTANDPTPGTGLWRVTGGSGTFSNAGQYNTTVTNMIVGQNTFEWEITRGACIQTDYVIITRNSPSIANAGPDKETCNGNVNLSAVNPAVGTGTWSVISGTGNFVNVNLNNTAVSNVGLNANVYRWTVNFAACSDYDDVIVTNNYVSTYAGPDQSTCSTSSVLDATQPGSGESGTWQVLAGLSSISNVNMYNSTVSNLTFGLNKYRWTVIKGTCSVYDDIEIFNNQYLASASVSGPSDICTNNADILGNIPPSGATAHWSITSGSGIFDNSTDESTTVRNLALGENIIRWTIIRSGCESYDEITINRYSVFADAGTDQSICTSYTTLNGNALLQGETGLWTRVSGTGLIASPGSNITDITGIAPGISIYKWTVSKNSCLASDDITITNNTFFVSAGVDQQICTSSTTLTANDPTPGIGWWQVVTGSAVIVNPSHYTTVVSNLPGLSVTTFRWSVTKNGCFAQDDIAVYNNSITAYAGSDFPVCNNFTTLNGNNSAPGTGVWTIQVGGGTITNPNNPTSAITGLSPNTNIIRWTVSHLTCVTYDEVMITNNSLIATAGSDMAVCENQTQLSGQAPPTGGTGLWQIISGNGSFQNPSLFNTGVSNLNPGFNTFRWTVYNNGCSSPGDDVIINNKSFIANAGNDQILAQFVTDTYMHAVLPSGGIGQWTILSGGGTISSISDPSTYVSNLNNGINSFRWYVQYNGCTSIDYVDITAINFEAYAGIDKTICTDSLKLSARDDGGIPQFWSVISGSGEFVDPNLHDTWVKNIGLGENIYRWTVTITGATDTDDVMVTRVESFAGQDQILCENHTFLDGNSPLFNSSGNWLVIAGAGTFVDPTLYNTEVTNLANQNNTFAWVIDAGICQATDYVLVQYDFIYANAGTDRIICTNPINMDADQPQVGMTGLWSVISGYADIINPTLYDTQIVNMGLGNNVFKWTVSSVNCQEEDMVSMFNDEVIADAGNDQNSPNNYAYLYAILPDNAFGIWTLEFGAGIIIDETDPETFVTGLSQGTNIFKWSLTSEYCSDNDVVHINYYPTEIVDLPSNLKIYPNPFTEFLMIENNENYKYHYEIKDILGKSLISGILSPNSTNYYEFSTLKSGIYFIHLIQNSNAFVIKVVKK